MSIDVRIHDLLSQKYGDDEEKWPSNLQIADEVGIRPSTLVAWMKKRLDRADFETLDKWCVYFDVGVGDILVRIPPEKRKH